jgi:hypothetical protein
MGMEGSLGGTNVKTEDYVLIVPKVFQFESLYTLVSCHSEMCRRGQYPPQINPNAFKTRVRELFHSPLAHTVGSCQSMGGVRAAKTDTACGSVGSNLRTALVDPGWHSGGA